MATTPFFREEMKMKKYLVIALVLALVALAACGLPAATPGPRDGQTTPTATLAPTTVAPVTSPVPAQQIQIFWWRWKADVVLEKPSECPTCKKKFSVQDNSSLDKEPQKATCPDVVYRDTKRYNVVPGTCKILIQPQKFAGDPSVIPTSIWEEIP